MPGAYSAVLQSLSLSLLFVCLFVWRRVKGHDRREKGTYKYRDDSTPLPDISHAAPAPCGRLVPNCGGVGTTHRDTFSATEQSEGSLSTLRVAQSGHERELWAHGVTRLKVQKQWTKSFFPAGPSQIPSPFTDSSTET